MDSDSETSDSSTSTSSSEGASLPDEERLEPALILGATVDLPQDLCENSAIFKEFFSINTWNCLSEANKQHLRNFLPSFPENDQEEKEISLNKLFAREIFKFTSPLVEFQKNLHEGNYRPDIAKMREILKKTRRKEQRFQEREICSQMLKDVLVSRQKLLDVAYNSPPGVPLKVERSPYNPPKQGSNPTALRAKKRYFQELSNIVAEVGMPGHVSDDENYPEGPIPQLSRKQRRHLSGMQGGATSPGAEERVYSTMCTRDGSLDHLVGPGGSAPLTEESYKLMLTTHKKRRIEHDDHPELDVSGITLYDVSARTRAAGGHRRPIQAFMPQTPEAKTKKSHSNRTMKSEGGGSALKTMHAASGKHMDHASDNNTRTSSLSAHHRALFHHGYSSNSDSDELDSSAADAVDPPPPPPPVVQRKPVKAPVKRASGTGGGKTAKPKASKQAPITATTPAPAVNNTFSIVGMTSPIVHAKGENITISHNVEPTPTATAFIPHHLTGSEPPVMNHHSGFSIRGTAATLSDLEGIDMMHLPVDLDDSNIDILDEMNEKTPELMQETHVCFLSLIRDIICSTADHRIALDDLERRLIVWQENPISPLNDWYCLHDNWSSMLGSVVQFLTGEFTDQPDDFVPYLEYKPNLRMYQWIGAGRDSDNLLAPLCQYWFEHRNSMVALPAATAAQTQQQMALEADGNGVAAAERPQTPPPPKCPTNWKVRKATADEVAEFQRQERLRYEHPHRAFTYRMHGYESVVAPIKGVYHQSPGIAKARGHSMLNADRPNFVTILTLVRDATARLPNGEGTRAEICELLRCSQYICGDAPDNVLQSVVSGALDRMHTEYDPCVKYDPKRKIWIYLHRNRTEAEFERVHQQIQTMGKHKKTPGSRKNAASSATAKQPKTAKTPKNKNIVHDNATTPSSPSMQTSGDSNVENRSESDISVDFNMSQNSSSCGTPKAEKMKIAKPLLEKPVKVTKPIVHHHHRNQISVQVETSDGRQTIPIQIAANTNKTAYTSLLNTSAAARSQSPAANNVLKISPKCVVNNNSATDLNNSMSIETMTTNTENSDTVSVAISIAQSTKSVTVQKQRTQQAGGGGGSPTAKTVSLKNLITTVASSPNTKTATGKSLMKVTAGKSLINPSLVVNQHNQQNQQQQVLVNLNAKTHSVITSEQLMAVAAAAAAGKTPLQNSAKVNNANAAATLITNASALGLLRPKSSSSPHQGAGAASNKPAQLLTAAQKQQFLQNILAQQQKQQLLQNLAQKTQQNQQAGVTSAAAAKQNVSQQQQVVGSCQQPQQQLVTQQQLQNLIANSQKQQQIVVSSGAGGGIMTTQQVLQTIAGQKVVTSQQQTGVTTLTPAQQQQIIQSLKQQQLKNAAGQGGGGGTQQYQVLLKQQAVQQLQKQLQQQQQQNQQTAAASGATASLVLPKTITAAQARAALQQQQQLLQKNQQQQPIMTKLLTNASGQVISVESLLAAGKQSSNIIQQGGQTLRVTPKQGQNHLIRLAAASGGNPSSQTIQQFAMVSQGGGIITMSNARMVTSSAAAAANSNTSAVTINSPQRLVKQQNIQSQQQQQTPPRNQQKQLLQQQQQQQLMVNAKLLGLQTAQGKIITSPSTMMQNKQGGGGIIRSNLKAQTQTISGNTIRMVNAAGLNIAHIGGKPVILASKGAGQLQGQNVILQTATTTSGQNDTGGNLVMKVPGNLITQGGNLNIINTGQNQSGTTQTVMLGGQMIKVQNAQQQQQQQGGNQQQQSVMLSGGQAIKVQNQSGHQNALLTQQQQLMLGQALKVQQGGGGGAVSGGQLKTTAQGGATGATVQGQRVVLTSQGQAGQLLTQQILLPPGFQGGSINIKTLQGLKVIPIAQQTKGALGGRQQVFTRLVAPPTPPRPPPPGGD